MTVKQNFLRISAFFFKIYSDLINRTLGIFCLVTIIGLFFPSDIEAFRTLHSFVTIFILLGVIPSNLIKFVTVKKDTGDLSSAIGKLTLDIYTLILVLILQPAYVEKMLNENSAAFFIVSIKLAIALILCLVAMKFIRDEICNKRNRNMLKLVVTRLKLTETSETVNGNEEYKEIWEKEYKIIGVPIYYIISVRN